MEYLFLPKFLSMSNSKLLLSQDYININSKISEQLLSYHKNNYKKVNSDSFETSIDYLYQKIRITVTTLEEADGLDKEIQGLILEKLLFDIDEVVRKKFIMNVKYLLLNIKDYILKDRIKTVLINYIANLEVNSSEYDNMLHLEKTCNILRNILEIDGSINEKDDLSLIILKYQENNTVFQERKLLAFKSKYIQNYESKKNSFSENEHCNSNQCKKLEELKVDILNNSPKIFVKNYKNNNSSAESTLLLPPSNSNRNENTNGNRLFFFNKLKKPKAINQKTGDNEKFTESKLFFDDVVNILLIPKSERDEDVNVITNNMLINEPIENLEEPKHNEIYINLDEVEKKKIYEYYIDTTPKDPLYFPETYGTDDRDIVLFTELINEPVNNGKFEQVVKEENINVFRRDVEGRDIILIKAYSTLNYDKEVVFKAIADVRIRKEWDKVFNEFKIIEASSEKEILYMKIDGPMTVADREFVQQRKIWRNFPDEKSHCIHFKSVDHKDVPYKKKVVRAETIISGYYISTMSIDPPKTRLISVSQTDIKGSIPKFIVNPIAAKAPKDWLNNLIKGCKIVSQGK